MGAAARRHALEHGTLDRAIEAYRAVYRTASGQVPSSSSSSSSPPALPVPRVAGADVPHLVTAGRSRHGSGLVGVPQ
jgi:hypothetical protein